MRSVQVALRKRAGRSRARRAHGQRHRAPARKQRRQRDRLRDRSAISSWRGCKGLDDVAYVRFASVYRDFREAKDFEDILGELAARAGEAPRRKRASREGAMSVHAPLAKAAMPALSRAGRALHAPRPGARRAPPRHDLAEPLGRRRRRRERDGRSKSSARASPRPAGARTQSASPLPKPARRPAARRSMSPSSPARRAAAATTARPAPISHRRVPASAASSSARAIPSPFAHGTAFRGSRPPASR